MSTQRIQEYDEHGNLVDDYTIEVAEAPPDPVGQLQAQVDALTDIVLGGTA